MQKDLYSYRETIIACIWYGLLHNFQYSTTAALAQQMLCWFTLDIYRVVYVPLFPVLFTSIITSAGATKAAIVPFSTDIQQLQKMAGTQKLLGYIYNVNINFVDNLNIIVYFVKSKESTILINDTMPCQLWLWQPLSTLVLPPIPLYPDWVNILPILTKWGCQFHYSWLHSAHVLMLLQSPR